MQYRSLVCLQADSPRTFLTGASPDVECGVQLKPDQYILVSAEVDFDLSRRWHVANRIRKSGGGAKARILQFLKENLGIVVTTEELAYDCSCEAWIK